MSFPNQDLLDCLKKNYELTVEDDGTRYLGMTLEWDYIQRKVHLSMPGYIPRALKRFEHEPPLKRQDQPYPHVPPNYGARVQYAKAADDSDPLSKQDKKFVMQVTGTFLFYARAIDSTMLPALSSIASEQNAPTKNTMKKVKRFLDYAASQEEAIITYRASDMVLSIHSDASYLSERNARSRAGGHHYLSDDTPSPPNNGAILNISQIIKMSWHPPLKPNWEHFSSMRPLLSPSDKHLPKWATRNHARRSKPTTPPRTAS